MEWPSIDEVACLIIYIYIYEYCFRDDFLIMHWNNLQVSEKLILPTWKLIIIVFYVFIF